MFPKQRSKHLRNFHSLLTNTGQTGLCLAGKNKIHLALVLCPGVRSSMPFSSAMRITFEACEGVIPVRLTMVLAVTVSVPTLHRTTASFNEMP